MSILYSLTLALGLGATLTHSLRYDPKYVDHNLNQNKTAIHPLDYWGEWEDHTYTESPSNWRFPIYTLFIDRFVNGNPSNDNANGTVFEQDITSTQMRHGGDVQGLIDSLDYIHGMGVKGIYIAGSPFINQPWQSDSYSPLDLTLLDAHYGNILEWRRAVDEIHKRGMYVLFDNTVATMGDLLGFEGFLNESTPFAPEEHKVVWKTSRRYLDFDVSDSYNETCSFPRFWNETGYPIDQIYVDEFKGCYNSDFDQFGDTEAFGVYPDYRRQITKFASVQDRLREWVPSVREKLSHFSCMAIRMLDIDGFRYDKAIQVTADASGNFSAAVRECARQVGKKNFFLPGEITGGNNIGSIYLGRGRQPDQWLKNLTEAVMLNNASDSKYFLRESQQIALDAAAFSYSVYRFMTRFLGMDGNLEAGFDLPMSWVDAWNQMLISNDFVNADTGVLDPRHMFGVTNQDVFRWPGIRQGVHRMLLGQFITTILLPGIPLVLWGEEQAFYVLDNTADNYIFGRQAMSPSPAWYLHGCYAGSSTQYFNMPLNSTLDGCKDVKNSWDHRDPSHPVRGIMKSMFHLRQQYPVLTDGLFLSQLSNQTDYIYLPGSNGTGTETGIWSVVRSAYPGVQDLGDTPPIWLVFHNKNDTTTYTFNCSSNASFLSPFDAGTPVKNLFFPHHSFTVGNSSQKLFINGSQSFSGCADTITLLPYEFRAYVPASRWVPPPPMITKFLPGHDVPVSSTGSSSTEVDIAFHFSAAMSCDSVTSSLRINSTGAGGTIAGALVPGSVKCAEVSPADGGADRAPFIGALPSAWRWSARLSLSDGIHAISVANATTEDLGSFTQAIDTFLIRVGKTDNPLVFPATGNYSASLLAQDRDGKLRVKHTAPGADLWRYSLNWGSSWSEWTGYEGGEVVVLKDQAWAGTKQQEWEGQHVIVQYFSRLLGSSSFVQHGDVGFDKGLRRFPHLWANGRFNQFGFDAGIKNMLQHAGDGRWEWHYMDEWPGTVQVNVWGMNPDGQPDQTFIFGDIDKDFVLDRMPPSAMAPTVINVTDGPEYPYLSYRFALDDGTLRYELVPQGDRRVQLAFFVLLWLLPVATGFAAVFVFIGSFYKVKVVEKGIKGPTITLSGVFHQTNAKVRSKVSAMKSRSRRGSLSSASDLGETAAVSLSDLPPKRRTVLIATVEYNIDDWNVKVKIGGLGVMAQLMGKALGHQDLIWVVPCVGDIKYPEVPEECAEPMTVTILDATYQVNVSYHQVENITYVLLDAPVFRQQTKAEPYPPRMDNIDSAIYYSTWNQCIAQTITRFPVDIYHINDYHGGIAPLYLLPSTTIPCCLSLHNAEFQGLWPLRTPEERKEVCGVFNLPSDIVQQYVQFGSVFNLLHAAVSYLRVHQAGFGAVGVSKKYGDRSFARYPIFWGLSQIGQLPNPDPSDMEEWDAAAKHDEDVVIDAEFEASRGELRRQTQEWAGLEANPDAELFVFVGRWSQQKGVDLIADLFPAVLEEYPNTQLVCIGPTIDLYGKFAAMKLSKLMELYPKRVFSKPEFTSLPPYIFSGAEFALIPSRDEPFGLVAVEFGRKGALGVGAKVGGLGQMPGWWYTIESASTTHLLSQFKQAVVAALESKKDVRAKMRAWSAKQRFPVAQWLEGLEKLQGRSIKMHHKMRFKGKKRLTVDPSRGAADSLSPSRALTPTTPKTGSMFLPERPSSPEWPLPPTGRSTPDLPPPGFGGFGHSQSPRNSDVGSIYSDSGALTPPRPRLGMHNLGSTSLHSIVSVDMVVGGRTDFKLQQVDAFFTDADGKFSSVFEKKLDKLNAKNSISALCIEEYLVESERDFFDAMRDVKLGTGHARHTSTAGLVSGQKGTESPDAGAMAYARRDAEKLKREEYGLAEDYVPPTGLKKLLQRRLGEWPIYSIFLAFGQIIASNSYQITLLTGELGQTATRLYAVASIYLVTSILWGILSRTTKAIYSLTLPWIFYGLAFLFIGVAPFSSDPATRVWIQNAATGLYATGSSSGAIFFAFNFGDEGGSPVETWIWRACVIQGVQQTYTVMLWFWGNLLSTASATGSQLGPISPLPVLFPVTFLIAIILFACGVILFIGLPNYYRQSPDEVPSLYASILRRKTTLWFFVAVILQNYFLSSPYGRNWFYLFSSQHLPVWGTLLLTAFFYIVVWAAFLAFFAVVSKRHPWWLPLFALGLGAPRWAQMLWGTSGFGLYLPWTGSALWSAILSRSLWLWLGLLDTVQNAGIGMILMLTLTRIHVCVAMLIAQVIGSVATIVARASAPNNVGPGDVFPDFSEGVGVALSKVWFWIALVAQLIICVGFFKFFRKEQISKP